MTKFVVKGYYAIDGRRAGPAETLVVEKSESGTFYAFHDDGSRYPLDVDAFGDFYLDGTGLFTFMLNAGERERIGS